MHLHINSAPFRGKQTYARGGSGVVFLKQEESEGSQVEEDGWRPGKRKHSARENSLGQSSFHSVVSASKQR